MFQQTLLLTPEEHREVRPPAQGHTAGPCRNPYLTSGVLLEARVWGAPGMGNTRLQVLSGAQAGGAALPIQRWTHWALASWGSGGALGGHAGLSPCPAQHLRTPSGSAAGGGAHGHY